MSKVSLVAWRLWMYVFILSMSEHDSSFSLDSQDWEWYNINKKKSCTVYKSRNLYTSASEKRCKYRGR